jgi:Holliday junction resolvase RusA-like endonuclease
MENKLRHTLLRLDAYCQRNPVSPQTVVNRLFGSTYKIDRMLRKADSLRSEVETLNLFLDQMGGEEAALSLPAIDLVLPIPTSTNALHRVGAGRVSAKTGIKAKASLYRSEDYAKWRTAAGGEILLQRPKLPVRSLPNGPYGLELHVPLDDAGDTDNRSKAVSDLLVDMAMTPDDKQMHDCYVSRRENVPAGRIHVRAFALPIGGGAARSIIPALSSLLWGSNADG